MRTPLFLFLVSSCCYAFLSFTFDTRDANEKGLINPMTFISKHLLVVWAENRNKPDKVIYNKYMERVKKVYGNKKASLIEPVSRMAISLYQQLPKEMKKTVDGVLAGFRNGSLKFSKDTINQIVPKVLTSVRGSDLFQFILIQDRIEKEFIPLAGKVFYNPFDQERNDKLNRTDVKEIPLFPGFG